MIINFFLWGQLCTWNNPRSRERDLPYHEFSQTAQVLALCNFAQVTGVVEILPRLLGLWKFCPGCWGHGMAEFICGMVGVTFALKPHVVLLL
jgi:hypothetical protein